MPHRSITTARRLALSALFVASGCAPDGRTTPNVVLVVVDALRQDRVGFLGADRPTTPFLDRLAEESAVFERAHAQGSATFASTASLFSGHWAPLLAPPPAALPEGELEPEERRRHRLVPALAAQEHTLAELLSEAGYATMAVFTNPHHHSRSGFWQGFEETRYLPPDPGTAYARASSVHGAFFDWLDGRGHEGPFFAYLHLMDPHAPYRPPRVFRRLFVGEDEGGGDPSAGSPRGAGETDSAGLELLSQLYDAEVRFTDGVLRDLVADLRAQVQEPTVLVLTADHGEELMDHGGLGHGRTLHGELLRVPLLLHGPTVPAVRVSALVRNLDLVPTILELTGTPVPPELDGESLLPLLREPPAATNRTSFAREASLRSLTTERWHFVFNLHDDSVALFDLERDPEESRNLSQARPDLVGRFRDVLLDQLRREDERRARAGSLTGAGPPDARALEQLRSLGYLGD